MNKKDVERLAASGDTAGLVAALEDKHIWTRAAAIDALKGLGTGQARDALVQHALYAGHLSTRGTAAAALGALGDPRAVEADLTVLRDGWHHEIVSGAALIAKRLGESAQPAAVDGILALMELHQNDKGGPWPELCESLGKLDDARATGMLARVVPGTLGMFHQSRLFPADQTKAAAFEALERFGDRGVDALTTLDVSVLGELARAGLSAAGPHPRAVAAMAIEALWRVHDDRARGVLVALRNVELAHDSLAEFPVVAAALDDVAWASGPGTQPAGPAAAPAPPRLPTPGRVPPAMIQPTAVPQGAAVAVGDRRVAMTTGDIVRPGGPVGFLVRADPWPDPKLEAIEVEVGYRSSFLVIRDVQRPTAMTVLVGALATPPGPVAVERGTSGDATDNTVVARGEFPAADLDPSGCLAGSFVVPERCPPTIPGVVTWILTTRFHRRKGHDRHPGVELTVLSPSVQQVASDRTAADDHPSDWLHRVVDRPFGWFANRLALADRTPCVWLAVPDPIVAPGHTLQGTVLVRLDETAFGELPPRTARQARATGVGELPAVSVVLECWRGSQERESCQRMLAVDARTAASPPTFTAGAMVQVPFSVEVPPTAHLQPSYGVKTEGPVPPTCYGTRLPRPMLDDVRWRIVARVGRIGDKAMDRSVLWTASEVLVTNAVPIAKSV